MHIYPDSIDILLDLQINKIKIRPIDALLEVLGFTTLSIYLVFQFD